VQRLDVEVRLDARCLHYLRCAQLVPGHGGDEAGVLDDVYELADAGDSGSLTILLSGSAHNDLSPPDRFVNLGS
jgi:hypothetical protein